MAVSNQEVAAYLAANPTLSDAQIVSAMAEYGVSPAQMAAVTGLNEGEVVSRVASTLPPGQNANLGGTWVQPVYDSVGQGETFEQGPLKEVMVYKENQTTGDAYNRYSPSGELVGTNKFQEVGGIGDMLSETFTTLSPVIIAALTGGGAAGLLGSTINSGLGLGLSTAGTSALGGAALGGLTSAATGGNVLQGALLGGAGGYFAGANAGSGIQTDASFLAADAAQLASQGLSESAISQVLGASGYASGAAANLAASMAVNGLDVSTMTNQLEALSTNTGLMSQTGSSADFAAADALQLQGQLGNDFAAIEQNLIASGVDSLVAADISNQLAFNTNLTQADLATSLSKTFGNNIYDVNVADTYITSGLSGTGGLLSDVTTGLGGLTADQLDVINGLGGSDVAGGLTTTDATTAGLGGGFTDVTTGGTTGVTTDVSTGGLTGLTGLTTDQIITLVKSGVSLTGLLGAGKVIAGSSGGGGGTTTFKAPTQGVPLNNPDYYNQLQQYYNAYMPQSPRDVVTPLQQWYNSSYGA